MTQDKRDRLPSTRPGITHKFVIRYKDEHDKLRELEGFLTANQYDDGRVGELFITVDKEGTTIGGLCDVIGVLISVALQSGVPLEKLCEKMEYTRYEPSGSTYNKDIPFAKSLTDYISQWLGQTFLGYQKRGNYEQNSQAK